MLKILFPTTLSESPERPVATAADVCYRLEPVKRQPSASSALRSEALGHADALYRLAYHLSGNSVDAEDLVQDTYARALGAEERFEEGSNLKAWLFRILRNLHIDRYRRARGRGETSLDDVDEAGLPARELLRDDHELDRLRKVVGEDIEAALQALSPDARTVVLLDVEGFSESEVATVLGCPLGTVKSRLLRARQALRLRLKDYAR